ncbi:MAG TPA: carboxymuconolactone decarboxylase family protein [Chloroflexota bacterium]|nr:carboxymuconolactone decarboxylase family protein [Chloroflexota bacterium]
MARVRLIAPEAATAEQRAAFAEVGRQRGGAGNLFRALAHSPELMRRVGALGAFLRFEAPLPARLREAVILAVAGRWACAYERQQHRPLAARLGLGEAALAALEAGQVPAELTPLEATAVRYALALARDGQADDATVARLRAALGERGLVELTALVGYYVLLALFLNGLAVDLDATPPLPST